VSAILQVQDVYKIHQATHDEVPVLRGVSFDVEEGEFVCIMGPSGSGKSTLMNLIGLLDRPTTGEITVNGKRISVLNDAELSALRGKEIGFIFQSFNLVSRLSALKNVEMPMIFQETNKQKRTEIARRHLEEVGLGDRMTHRPNELSGGQRQRVAIARALVNDPAMILADEATGNLDSQTALEILELLDELHAEGKTIILVTHEPDVSVRTQHVLRLKDGRIEEVQRDQNPAPRPAGSKA